jgi:hypothetical protein
MLLSATFDAEELRLVKCNVPFTLRALSSRTCRRDAKRDEDLMLCLRAPPKRTPEAELRPHLEQ